MHGLLNRSLELFLRETCGDDIWTDVAIKAAVDVNGFDGLRFYPDEVTTRLLRAAAGRLEKSPADLLEDSGGWLVRREALRRLLRFSGSTFTDFVLSLEELPGRARMILPDLPLPPINVTQTGQDRYRIEGQDWPAGFEWMVAGALRGMADDFGVLALIDICHSAIDLRVMLQGFATGKPFTFAPSPNPGLRA